MSAFAQAFLRTSRAALSKGSSSSPIQKALGVHGSARYAAACRCYATAVFERNKPHVNIGKYLSPTDQLITYTNNSKVQSVTSTTAKYAIMPYELCPMDLILTR